MICNECKAKPATLHYVSIINGVQHKKDLCSDCAAKLGFVYFAPFTWGDLFSQVGISQAQKNTCSKCGTTLEELKQKGVVGCENCYSELRMGIEPLLKKVQKSLTHVGRSPANTAANKLPRPGETNDSPRELNEMEKLQKELREAISLEKFEEAAIVRDKIKAVKEKQNNTKDISIESKEELGC